MRTIILFSSLMILIMGFFIYKKNFVSRTADYGDSPLIYGISLHLKPEEGPYFGEKRGDDDRKIFQNDVDVVPCADDSTGSGDDEDAFNNNYTATPATPTMAVFLPDINTSSKSYILNIPIRGALPGDPVRGWIDFDGNGKFDEYEKASTKYEAGSSVTLTWVLPIQLYSALTFARIRTCSELYEDQIEEPAGEATTGEVEDYAVRIINMKMPATGTRSRLSLDSFSGFSGFDSCMAVMNKLDLDGKAITYRVDGVKPEMAGINNMHEASVTGLRFGHDDIEISKTPIISNIGFSKSVENLSFQLLDIDGGDKVSIEVFYNGHTIPFHINSLTDNFYYQYNIKEGAVWSQGNSDSGNDDIMPSSMDMGVEVFVNGYADSVRLSYFDLMEGSTGTYTLANISGRKLSFLPFTVKELSTVNNSNDVKVAWQSGPTDYITHYIVERSYDGLSFEVLNKIPPTNKNAGDTLIFVDNALNPAAQLCYYRVKTIASDNSITTSDVKRVRRNTTTGLSGFYFTSNVFQDTLTALLLVDMPGVINVKLYDYDGNVVRQSTAADKKKNDKIIVTGLGALEQSTYYLEIINQQNKYLLEVLRYDIE
jgi:hypothetical protein